MYGNKTLLSVIFSEVSTEAKDYCEAVHKMEMKIQEKSKEVGMEEQDIMKDMIYDVLGTAGEMFFCIGFKYGVQMMIECSDTER